MSDPGHTDLRRAAIETAENSNGGLIIENVDEIGASSDCNYRARATLITLNNALLPMAQRVETSDRQDLLELIKEVAATSRRRARLQRFLTMRGAVALVDVVTEAALSYADQTVGSILPDLMAQPSNLFTIAPLTRPAVKAWLEDGRLVCAFELDQHLRWHGDRLILRGLMPSIYISGLVGKPLSIIADHPLLSSDVTIKAVNDFGSEIEILPKARSRLVARAELQPSPA
jgi:hypothetical protein